MGNTPSIAHTRPLPGHMVSYLESFVIPDLKESGMHATAEDFEDCVRIIKDLETKLCKCPGNT